MSLFVLGHRGIFDTTWSRLRRLRRLGIEVRCAVDGGAAVGEWLIGLKRVYPQAMVVCIEPRDDAQRELRAVAARYRGVHVVQALLGEREGEGRFHISSDQSSLLPNAQGKPFGESKWLPMATLDRLLAKGQFPSPDLIKLDLQGAELICLAGATACLRHAQVVILETLFLPIYHGAPVLADIVRFMDERGFVCYDVMSLWHRPLDDALAYGDLLFIRKENPLLRDSRWSITAAHEQCPNP